MENLALTLSMKALHSRIRWNDSERHGHYPAWSMPIRSPEPRQSPIAKAQHTPIGRPPRRPSKDPKVLKEQRKQEREDTKILMESKANREGKRFYGLD